MSPTQRPHAYLYLHSIQYTHYTTEQRVEEFVSLFLILCHGLLLLLLPPLDDVGGKERKRRTAVAGRMRSVRSPSSFFILSAMSASLSLSLSAVAFRCFFSASVACLAFVVAPLENDCASVGRWLLLVRPPTPRDGWRRRRTVHVPPHPPAPEWAAHLPPCMNHTYQALLNWCLGWLNHSHLIQAMVEKYSCVYFMIGLYKIMK